MPRFDRVIFDLDGTLIDSAPDIGAALNILLSHHDRRTVSVEEVRQMVGDGAANLLRQAFARTGAPLPEDRVQPVLAEFLPIYGAQPADPDSVYPGVVETLDALAADGVRLGLCTNKPEAITLDVLDQLGLRRFFSAVAGGDTLPVRKPDGRHLAWVVERLGADGHAAGKGAAGNGNGRAAMVGDSRNDVQAARGAGLPVVAVAYGYPRMAVSDLGADVVIDRFADLPGALAGLA